MLRDDINNALKDAMKAGEARRVSTLRLVNATLKNADIEARGQSKPALTDDDVLGVLQKMIKQRHESVELYEKGGRPELAAQESGERVASECEPGEGRYALTASNTDDRFQKEAHRLRAQGHEAFGFQNRSGVSHRNRTMALHGCRQANDHGDQA